MHVFCFINVIVISVVIFVPIFYVIILYNLYFTGVHIIVNLFSLYCVIRFFKGI